MDGLMIRGDELTIRGCELLSNLIKQCTKGDPPSSLPPVPSLMEGVFHYIVLFESSWSYTC